MAARLALEAAQRYLELVMRDREAERKTHHDRTGGPRNDLVARLQGQEWPADGAGVLALLDRLSAEVVALQPLEAPAADALRALIADARREIEVA